jgi:hypothetical protein
VLTRHISDRTIDRNENVILATFFYFFIILATSGGVIPLNCSSSKFGSEISHIQGKSVDVSYGPHAKIVLGNPGIPGYPVSQVSVISGIPVSPVSRYSQYPPGNPQ